MGTFNRTSRSIASDSQLLIDVRRPVYDQHQFDENYGAGIDQEPEVSLNVRQTILKTCACSRNCVKKSVKQFFPISVWLRRYDIRKDLFADIMAGITVGIMNIPQGLAYGMLTGLAPVYGLYTSVFPPLIYAIFGTSKQMSVGTFAVISLMVASAVEKTSKILGPYSISNATTTTYSVDNGTNLGQQIAAGNDCWEPYCLSVQIATSLSLLVGLIMVCFGIMHLGFIASYMSDQLVQGLTCGASVHVLTSQIAAILGLRHMPGTDSVLGLGKYYVLLFQRIGDSNAIALLGSLICLVTLVIYKEFVHEPLKRRIKFAFPVELVLVVAATLVSHFVKLKQVHRVPIVGTIPTGIPAPIIPRFDLMPYLFVDAIVIAIVMFAISVSIAKTFAKKHAYRVRPNQEWYAYGFASAISSVFSCHCCCGSLSRSAVQDGQGGKTQLASFVASLLIASVLLALANLFEELPTFALAAIIVVNLKGMLFQLRELSPLWKNSRIDFLIWIVTFGFVLILNVTYGLAIGVIFSLATVIVRSQWPDSLLLGKVPKTDIYKAVHMCKATKELPGVKIFRFDAPLFFANAENFKSHLSTTIGLDPLEYRRKVQKHNKAASEVLQRKQAAAAKAALPASSNSANQGGFRRFGLSRKKVSDAEQNSSAPACWSMPEETNTPSKDNVIKQDCVDLNTRSPSIQTEAVNSNGDATVSVGDSYLDDASITVPALPIQPNFHHIIIDCSTFPYVDQMGVAALQQVYEDYREIGITVFFATCKVAIRHRFQLCGFYKIVPKHCLFLTIHDAVMAALTYDERAMLKQQDRRPSADLHLAKQDLATINEHHEGSSLAAESYSFQLQQPATASSTQQRQNN